MRSSLAHPRPPEALETELATPLPELLTVGRGTALLLAGRCRHPSKRIVRLEIGLGGRYKPAVAHTTERLRPMCGRDLWWAFVPIAKVDEATVKTVELRARLPEGTWLKSPLGAVKLVPDLPHRDEAPVMRGAERGDSPIAVCMATWNPPMQLFHRQVESIRAQDHSNWLCVISDDGSTNDALSSMHQILAGDDRFILHRFPERLGFYRNFERALALAPKGAEFVALCDQDDVWAPNKLSQLRAAFAPDTLLAFSDMRLVTETSEVLSPTYWNLRKENHTDLRKLLLANTVTGAASMFRHELLDSALPFPPRSGDLYHDHWLATVALSLGRLAFVDRPLFDYVQHQASAQGHAAANFGALRPRRTWRGWVQAVPEVLIGRRVPAFYTRVFIPSVLMATIIEERSGSFVEPAKRAVLRGFMRRDPGIGTWLLRASLRPGLRNSATLGRERSFLAALSWERLTKLRGRTGVGTISRPADWS